MDKNKFLTDNIIFFFLPIIVLCAGIWFNYQEWNNFIGSQNTLKEKEQTKITSQQKLQELEERKLKEETIEEVKEKTSQSGKVIYEVLGQQFSSEASFGIMFENIISNITNNGVRIRSIDYNYSPQNDKVLQTNAAGYNACELSFTTVSDYAQLQNFFKSIAKENYLTSIQEVYIEPYAKDKKILITKFKIRLYTKTVHG